jgi:hypothetical protein
VTIFGGVGEIVEAWPGAVVILEYHWYPGEEASLWVAELGEATKEGIVVDEIIPRPRLASAPVHCHVTTDGGVGADATHERAGRP